MNPSAHPTWLEEPAVRAFAGALVADALAMPVHWYYDRAALDRDYGPVTGYLAPRDHHPDSILWRSRYDCTAPEGEILHDRRRHWGQAGVHYHRGLAAGENTLNALLALELAALVRRNRHWDAERWLEHYVAFMRRPDSHRDTYVEEYHRDFCTNLAAGRKPINCGVRDIHIGGLVPVPALAAALGPQHPDLRRVVGEHVGLTHKDRDVLAAADGFVRILAAVCRGAELREAILDHGRDWISRARLDSWRDLPDRAVVGTRLSSACYIADAFPASLALAWRHADDFVAGVAANAACGGDNCHRGAVVGALLGAARPIPAPLLEGLACLYKLEDIFDTSPTLPGAPTESQA
ncbi:MAG: ADP-ribosylglycohydrolase family protein [Planctomycetaceae bacterium]